MHPGTAALFTQHGGQLRHLLPELLEALTKIIHVAKNLGQVEVRYDVHS